MNVIDVRQAKADFDDFLFSMDDQLEALEAEAEKRGVSLDVGIDSLEALENLFFLLTDSSDNDERDSLIVTFARYVGEIVRETYQGKWALSLDDPKSIYFNMPVIVNHTSIPGIEFSPIHAMRALSLRRKHGLLRKIINASVQPRELGIDNMEEKS